MKTNEMKWVIREKQRKHARRRLRERYQNIDTKIVKELNKILKYKQKNENFEILEVRRETNSRNFYHVKYDGIEYRLIFSKKTDQIITFLLSEEEYDFYLNERNSLENA